MGWLPKTRIVVPVDFSDDSLAAVETALQMVDSAANVHIVHVLRELSPLEPGEVWDTVNTESRTEFAARSLRERLSDPKYENLTYKFAAWGPGTRNYQLCRESGGRPDRPSLARSHRRLSHLLIGSVAERIVRLAHCPVLVLRT